MTVPSPMNLIANTEAVGFGEELRQACLVHLTAALALSCRGCRLRLNRNSKTMLSLRGCRGGSVVSLHVGLLDHPDALADLPGWVAANGRRITPRLRQTLQAVWREQRQRLISASGSPTAPDLEPLPTPFDLSATFAQVHGTWFSHLPRPAIRWARRSPQRPLTSIRFACYRSRPHPVVVVNRRLAQPWVARIFVEHVFFHELCHHAQACAPIRRESPHSRRFRQWEREYPHHQVAIAWEGRHLERFLSAT